MDIEIRSPVSPEAHCFHLTLKPYEGLRLKPSWTFASRKRFKVQGGAHLFYMSPLLYMYKIKHNLNDFSLIFVSAWVKVKMSHCSWYVLNTESNLRYIFFKMNDYILVKPNKSSS